jgi:hypothetical protein
MKKYIFLLFSSCFLTFSVLKSQQTTTQFLQSYRNDERFASNERLTEWLKSKKFHVPMLRKAEFRFGLNGSAFQDTIYGNIRNEDAYGIVLSPNSFRERRQQKQYKSAQIDVYEAEKNVLLHQALLDRYQVIAELMFAPPLLRERAKLDSFFVQKQQILQKTIENGMDIKVKDLIDSENDRNALQNTQLELENQIQFQQNKAKQLANENTIIEENNRIKISNIFETIYSSLLQKTIENPVIPFKIAQNQLATANMNVEKSNNRQIFNYIQAAYENPIFILPIPDKQKSVNNFSVRVGLLFPIVGNNNFKVAQTGLQVQISKENIGITRNLTQKNVELQVEKLLNLKKSYELCTQQIERSPIRKMLDNDKLLQQITLLEVVELRLIQQKLIVKRHEIEREIGIEYVRWLDLTGVMSAVPLKNYFSKNLDSF